MLLAMGGFRVGFWDRRAKLYKVEESERLLAPASNFKTLIDTHTLPGQKACVCALMRATEGFKVGCGGMGGWRDGWIEGWADR
jgi:hypothetical protein